MITKSPDVCEIEISYKSKIKPSQRRKISKSQDMYALLKEVYDESKVEYIEEFFIVLLNRRNAVLGWAKISSGGTAGTVVDSKVIFSIALAINAHGIILSHNHPSGEVSASEEDKRLTKKIVEGGKILDISILDHIIYTPETYLSFADEGLL